MKYELHQSRRRTDLLNQLASTAKNLKDTSEEDDDLEYFKLPDYDNWTGVMGDNWGNKSMPLRQYFHRNIEKEAE